MRKPLTFYFPFVRLCFGWLFCYMAYQNLIRSFNAELSHFDKTFKQFSLAWVQFCLHINSSKTVLFQTIKFSISTQFKYQKTVLFQTIRFSISTQAQCQKTIPFQTIQFGICTQFKCQKQLYFKHFNQALECIPQTSPSDCLVLYLGHSLGNIQS